MSGLVIRAAVPADLGQLVDLLGACGDLGESDAPPPRRTRDNLRAMMAEQGDDAIWLLAEDRQTGRVLGLQTVSPAISERGKTGWTATFTLPCPDQLAVASALFSATAERARAQGYTGLWVRVAPSNTLALAYYKSRGFEPVVLPAQTDLSQPMDLWYRLP